MGALRGTGEGKLDDIADRLAMLGELKIEETEEDGACGQQPSPGWEEEILNGSSLRG